VRRWPEGRIRAGKVERDVTFERLTHIDEDEIDAAYRSKYGRYGRGYQGVR
jgi:hypothetical protein